MKKCLLIKLEDGRKFFTKISHRLNLLEFSKTFKADLCIVETEKPELLSLKDLSTAICNKTNKGTDKQFTIQEHNIENKIKFVEQFTSFSNLNEKQKINSRAKNICNYIIEKLKIGDKININIVTQKLKKYNISKHSVYRYLNQAKKILLEKEGLKVNKLSPGIYIAN